MAEEETKEGKCDTPDLLSFDMAEKETKFEISGLQRMEMVVEETRVGKFQIINPLPTLKILITGRCGSSKSVLVNSLLEDTTTVKERHGVITTTRENHLQTYTKCLEGYELTLLITSSFQDGSNKEEVFQQLKKECSNVDIILYCIKMTETRFTPDNPDAIAIQKITETLGSECWKKAIFVLTYANNLAETICGISNAADATDENKSAFLGSIERWKEVLKQTLNTKGCLSTEECDLKAVPAGHYLNPQLPGIDHWISDIWSECANLAPSKEVIEKMVLSSRERTTTKDSSTDWKYIDYIAGLFY